MKSLSGRGATSRQFRVRESIKTILRRGVVSRFMRVHACRRSLPSRIRTPGLVFAGLTLASILSGCASTVALDHAVMAYDTTTALSVSKQLLLNIARARHNQPMHFTAISSIAATYKFTVNAGVTPALTGEHSGLLLPVIGGSSEENPTISIAPMQGDEFTQRLLTPFQEQKLTLLLRQGYDVDTLLRLLGAEIRLEDADSRVLSVNHNRPSDPDGYLQFRRIVAHLSAIQDRQSLHVEPLHYQFSWTVPEESVTPESFLSTYKEFSVTHDEDHKLYRIAKRINGRVMITNYDPGELTNHERFELHEQADEAPFNDILIDIRPGHVGGDWPIHGRLRLRSFHEVLTFIGRGIEEEPEIDVKPDPRTPSIQENPIKTLDIMETKELPKGVDLSVSLNGLQYALRPQTGYQWNRKAFSMLYQLFQMSVSEVSATGPAITIAK